MDPTSATPLPHRDIDRVRDAHRRLLSTIAGLTDADARRPSRLAGWSVGHVLTHLARNADSHVRRAAAAARGDMVDQYPGGRAGRQADIEEGAGRPAAELVDDVRRSVDAMHAAWRDLERPAWAGRTRDTSGLVRPLFELPARRWQEVEVHLVDLGLGPTERDWPDDFVVVWLPRLRERAWAAGGGALVDARFECPADELAWLYGRYGAVDLAPAPPWD